MSEQTLASSPEEPVFFWRESDPQTGWLSQWYECPFRDDKDPSKIYKTAEHYMMHHKALLFNDHATAAAVLKKSSPRGAKGLGRKVQPFDNETWCRHREAIVRQGNILKFTRAVTKEGFKMGTASKSESLPPIQGSLKEMLLRTGGRELVEASPFDSIWGIGFAAEDAGKVGSRRKEWGLNLLGKALMDVRTELREREEQEEEGQ